MKKIVTLALIVLPLLGCQQIARQKHEYIRNRSKDYLTSFTIAPLQVPADLSHPTPTEYYPLPENLPSIGKLSPVSLVPPGFGEMSEQAV